MEIQDDSSEKLRIDEFTRRHLTGLSRWASFLGTAGILVTLLMMISVILNGPAMVKAMYASNPALQGMEGSSQAVIVVMLVMMLIPLFMSLYLLRCGRRMQLGLLHERQDYLNNSLYNLKMVFKIFGIFVIVFLSLQILSSLSLLWGS